MAGLSVRVVTPTVRVVPGQTATVGIDVRNLGAVVDRFTCELLGLPYHWWSVVPASIELFPDSSTARPGDPPVAGRFTITIHPPRSPEALAGPWPIAAKITSEHTGERMVEEASAIVEPFGSLMAALTPVVSSGRRGAGHRLRIRMQATGQRPSTCEPTTLKKS